MNIYGFQKLTLLDYPGCTAATIFLGGCNFRCPYCQNSGLVLKPEAEVSIPEEEVWAVLKKRIGLLDGVCVSGGEPTLHKDLAIFINKIKQLGYQVKLDTNGTNPKMIKKLHQDGLIDCVAMDIKSSKEGYYLAAGTLSVDLSAIEDSVSYLMNSGIDYEFRTTVVRELHSLEDFLAIGKWLAGARAYYLQSFQDSPNTIQPGLHSYSKNELAEFCTHLRKTIPRTWLRGMD